MPHIWIECSRNVAAEPEARALKQAVYAAALETGIFPVGGIRVRFQVIEDYIVGDGDPTNAFVHIVLRIGHGRDLDTRRKAADHVFEKVVALLTPLRDRAPLAVAFEMQEMSAELNYKFNNLHEHIERRRNAA